MARESGNSRTDGGGGWGTTVGGWFVVLWFGLVAFNGCRIASITRMETWDNMLVLRLEFHSF